MHGSRIRAIIINRYKAIGNVYAEAVTGLTGQLGFLREQGLIDPGLAVLKPYIRDCTAVAKCADEHLPVINFNRKAIGAEDYRALATNFIFFFNRYEPK
jgi:cellulose biosynthesis protein BcsQ